MMADQKTKPTNLDVVQFLKGIGDDRKSKDCLVLLAMMREITNIEPVLWSGNIIGFGAYHYKYDSGHEGDACLIGFSPRKQNLALYILTGFENQQTLLDKLGKHKTGKVCLYINKLDDIHVPTLRQIIKESFIYKKKRVAE